ncbi:hypothetical protein [Luteolibacter sp. AS25]|uniref:hypothetical protein n=1 Tax=Luteolibacter sp. AS25 TaxID=3135776 RepID=UPI00398B7791
MKPSSNIISIALIGAGVAGFVVSSKPLLKNADLDAPLNPLGINRSPYGEVIAMAMQGPIDTFFHAVEGEGHKCDDPEHCQHHQLKKEDDLVIVEHGSWNDRAQFFIESLGKGLEERTNPRAATDSHKFYLRRGIEDKLRFAYNLDPGHYGNYNAYHFFLTEPQLGTRPELTPHAAKLADETIRYCLSQRSDPRQALTAAAAATNIIQLMFEDRAANPDSSRYTTEQMREVLGVVDQSIGLFSHLSKEWEDQGVWENLSELRIVEAQERLNFILKVRESQEAGIRRLEGLPSRQTMGNNSVNHTNSVSN